MAKTKVARPTRTEVLEHLETHLGDIHRTIHGTAFVLNAALNDSLVDEKELQDLVGFAGDRLEELDIIVKKLIFDISPANDWKKAVA